MTFSSPPLPGTVCPCTLSRAHTRMRIYCMYTRMNGPRIGLCGLVRLVLWRLLWLCVRRKFAVYKALQGLA